MPTVIEQLVISLRYDVDQTALEETREAAGRVAEEIARRYQESSEQVEESLEGTAEAAEDAGQRTERSARQSSSAFREVWTGALRRVGATIADFAIGLPGRLSDLTTEFIDSAREVEDWSQRLGESEENVQRLRFAAEVTGTDLDTFADGIQTLEENLGEFVSLGTGPATDSLGRLGLAAADLERLSTPTQRLELLAEAISEVPTRAEQTSIALEIFGGAGERLLPLLVQGAEGFRGLSERADELGVVLGGDAIRETDRLGRSLTELEAILDAAFGRLLVAAIPAIEDVVERISDWIDENEILTEGNLEDFIDDVSAAAETLVDVGAAVLEFLGEFNVSTDGAATATIALGVALGGIPGLAIAAGAGIAQVVLELTGLNDQIRDLQRQTARTQTAGEIFEEAQTISGDELAQLSAEEFNAFVSERENALIAAGVGGAPVTPADIENVGRSLELRREAGLRRQARAVDERQRQGIFVTDEEQQEIEGLARAGQASRRTSGARRRRAGLRARFLRQQRQGGGGRGSEQPEVQTDPLSELFGVAELPDIGVNDLSGGRSPQVLIATVNNTFTISGPNVTIDGADRPDLIPEQVADAFRELFNNEVARTSRFVASPFAR